MSSNNNNKTLLSSEDFTNLYFSDIGKALSEIKERNISEYKNTTIPLYTKYSDSRLRYYKVCRIWLRLPSRIADLTEFIVNFFYRQARDNSLFFYKHLEKTTGWTGYFKEICSIETLMWKKKFSELWN